MVIITIIFLRISHNPRTPIHKKKTLIKMTIRGTSTTITEKARKIVSETVDFTSISSGF